MIVLTYLGNQSTNFAQLVDMLLFLCTSIWSRVSGLMLFHDASDSEHASDFVQILENVWHRPWRWLDKRSGKKQWALHKKSKLNEVRERRDKWKVKPRALSSFSMTSRGWLFRNNSSWQAKQSTLHTAVTFYGDCLKMLEDFAPNFGDKRTGCCITTTHCLTLPFPPRNFWPNATWLSSSTQPTFFCFPTLR
jgi:hypothetical protein